MRAKLKYCIFLLIGITMVFCRKPRNGDYVMTETGTKIIQSCWGPGNCETKNEAVFTKSVVAVEDSKKHWLYVDGKKWDKDINAVYYTNSFTNEYSPTSSESFTFTYSGAIKHKFLIEGTYTINSVYYQNSEVYTTTNSGVFTLKVKK